MPDFINNLRKILILTEDQSNIQLVLPSHADNIKSYTYIDPLFLPHENSCLCSIGHADCLVTVFQVS